MARDPGAIRTEHIYARADSLPLTSKPAVEATGRVAAVSLICFGPKCRLVRFRSNGGRTHTLSCTLANQPASSAGQLCVCSEASFPGLVFCSCAAGQVFKVSFS